MILELADIRIQPGKQAEFDAAIKRGVETVVAKAGINTLIPALKDAGATDIIELPIAKIIH